MAFKFYDPFNIWSGDNEEGENNPLKNTPGKVLRVPQYTDEQGKAIQQFLPQGQEALSGLYNQPNLLQPNTVRNFIPQVVNNAALTSRPDLVRPGFIQQQVGQTANNLANIPQTPGIPNRNIQSLLGQSLGQVSNLPQTPGIPGQNINDLLGQTLQGSRGRDLSFDPIEAHARRQFNTQTVPGLAERFTALGGGQRSSAFGGQLGRMGGELESQLAAQRAQYGLQAGQLQNQQQESRRGLLGQLLGYGLEQGNQQLQGQQQGQNLLQNLLGYGVSQRGQNLQQQELGQSLLSSLLGAGFTQRELGQKQQLLRQNLLGDLLSQGYNQRGQNIGLGQALTNYGMQSPFQPLYQQASPGIAQQGTSALMQALPYLAYAAL